MPVLSLKFDTVSEVQELMAKDQADMDNRIKELTEAVRGLQDGDWVGDSASQFFQEYETLNTAWKRQMEIMRILAKRLQQEIEEWEYADSKFVIPFL